MRSRVPLFVTALFASVLAIFASFPLLNIASAENPPAATVRLIIDYGDGVEKHFNSIPWSDDLTVGSLMDSLSRTAPPRGLAYAARGDGERAMLISIDGLAGEGAGKDKRNWLFWVNDTPGDRSFAVAALKSGDTVAWRFASYDALQPKK